MSLPRPPAPLPLPPRAYKYDGVVLRVEDARHIRVEIDLGFSVRIRKVVRIHDAPFVPSVEVLKRLLPRGTRVQMQTYTSKDSSEISAYVVRQRDAVVISHALLDAAKPADDDGHAANNEQAKALRLVQEEATR